MLKIGLLGLGTVGTGVLEVLEQNRAKIERRAGGPLRVARALVRDPARHSGKPVELTTRAADVLEDPDIQIVVEVMGGLEPARSYMLEALGRGKAVVTANKEAVAEAGSELFAAAERGRSDLFFEASVAGGIPIIHALKESLAANRITEVLGIVNGTTNYILSQMSLKGREFTEALAEAQAKGYAEADPTADVEGHDAARKLAILASIAFEARVKPEHVPTQGIAGITQRDIRYARELGYAVKLLALAREEEGELEAGVYPALLPSEHPLSAVHDAFNAIFLRGDACGEAMFYGRGAGAHPTASAVLGDVVDAARHLRMGGRAVACTCYHPLRRKARGTTPRRHYLRLILEDRPGVLAQVARAFGDQGVSLTTVLQKAMVGELAEVVFLTHLASDVRIEAALGALSRLAAVGAVGNWLRIEGERG